MEGLFLLLEIFWRKQEGLQNYKAKLNLRSVTLKEYLGLYICCRDNILIPAPPVALYVGLHRNLWDVFSGPM
jgi:hypothetical protein